MTFSQHAAQHKSSSAYYLLLWVLILPPLYRFLITDFYDELSLTPLFILLSTATCLLMLIAAAVPETGGTKTTIHRLAAFSMATLFLPAVLLIALTGDVSSFAKVTLLLSAAVMLTEIIVLTVYKRKHPKMLWIQGSYIAIFYISILIAYYL